LITNKWITGLAGAEDALEIREEVFVQEQKTTRDNEFDSLDEYAMHVIIYDGDDAIATGRVCHDGKTFRIGRIAVRKQYRGKGYGDLLVKLLLLKVFEYNPSVVRIGAQEYAQKFYERYGFRKTGDKYMDGGLPHIPMEVTKETLVFKSDCGHDKTYYDFFPEKTREQAETGHPEEP
jgi:predicted GNAT family N-acyltransferase